MAGVLDDPTDMWSIGGVDLADYLDPDTGEIREDDLLGAAGRPRRPDPSWGRTTARTGPRCRTTPTGAKAGNAHPRLTIRHGRQHSPPTAEVDSQVEAEHG